MLQYLDWLDHRVFEFIQDFFRNEVLDPVFLALRDKVFWIPLYIFLLSWLFVNYGKQGWKIFAAALVLVTITDQLNSTVIKSVFKRERPCREIYFKDHFVPVTDCSGGLSFPSTHATNHMGLATFLFFTCGNRMQKWKWLIIVWALLVGFAQVYVGVHFPADVIAGWLEGFVVGYIIYRLFKCIFNGSLSTQVSG